jgi:hypothetical protein
MTSKLQKFFIPPIIAAAAVFGAMALPVALQGDKQVDIKWEQEPFFSGRVRDISGFYVIGASILGLFAGATTLAIIGWGASARRSDQIEQELSGLEQNLKQKDELLRELQLSESRLQVSGLSRFLDDEVPFAEVGNQRSFSNTVTQPVTLQTPPSVSQSRTAAPIVPVRQVANTTSTASSASTFASAQNFLGYSQTLTNHPVKDSNPDTTEGINRATVTPAEFDELQRQLRQMMLQMQAMQNNLQYQPQNDSHDVNRVRVYYDDPNNDEVRFR